MTQRSNTFARCLTLTFKTTARACAFRERIFRPWVARKPLHRLSAGAADTRASSRGIEVLLRRRVDGIAPIDPIMD
jgi:hypothetical protein